MKIALCAHQFVPHFMGGVEIYTLRLACAYRALGHSVHILTGDPVPTANLPLEIQQDVYQELPVTRLRYNYNQRPAAYRASLYDPQITIAIKSFLQTHQSDIVHATSLSLLMGGTIEAAWQLNIPLVYTATDFILTCRRGTYLKWDNTICDEKETEALCAACMGPHTLLENLLNRIWTVTPKKLSHPILHAAEATLGKQADFVHAADSIKHRLEFLPRWIPKIEQILAPSPYMRDRLILNGVSPHKIMVSPYGVDLPEANFSKKTSLTLRFGYIGRLTFAKGTHLLLEAFEALPLQEQAVELIIYGEADSKFRKYIQTFKKQAKHLSRIKFMGPVDNTKIAEAYRKIDVLIVSSIWPENSPITILEAQAHKTPVIAGNVKGLTHLITHKVNGLLFKNGSASDLTSQLAHCLSSPALVKKMADNSPPIKSIQDDAAFLLDVYKKILTSKPLGQKSLET